MNENADAGSGPVLGEGDSLIPDAGMQIPAASTSMPMSSYANEMA